MKYVGLFCNEVDYEGDPVECVSWEQLHREHPELGRYVFPERSGFFRFLLEWMCYEAGEYGSIYLYGRDLDGGRPVMLCYYSQMASCGIRPPHNPYLTKGVRLFVGCKNVDGEGQLWLAFPLPSWGADTEVNTESILEDILCDAPKRCNVKDRP